MFHVVPFSMLPQMASNGSAPTCFTYASVRTHAFVHVHHVPLPSPSLHSVSGFDGCRYFHMAEAVGRAYERQFPDKLRVYAAHHRIEDYGDALDSSLQKLGKTTDDHDTCPLIYQSTCCTAVPAGTSSQSNSSSSATSSSAHAQFPFVEKNVSTSFSTCRPAPQKFIGGYTNFVSLLQNTYGKLKKEKE